MMISKRADGRYEVKITLPNGKRKAFYGKTRTEATAKADTYKARMLYGDFEDTLLTVREWSEQWIDSYIAGTVKPSSFDSKYEKPLRLHILPVFGDSLLSEVKPMQIQQFFNEKGQVYSLNTIKGIKGCMFKMFACAVDNDFLHKNPVKNVKLSSRPQAVKKRFYDEETVDSILSYSHRYNYIIRLLLECGLRRSELCGLQWKNISRKGVKVEQAITTYRGKPLFGDPKTESSRRTVPISDELYGILEEVRKNTKWNKANNYIVAQEKTGKNINPQHFDTVRLVPFYKDYQEHMGLRDFPMLTPHEHRHTCGTLLYRKTRDIYKVMTFLGHSSVETTAKIYVHPDTESAVSYHDYEK